MQEYLPTSILRFPSNGRFFRRARNLRILSIFLLARSAQPMAMFAFDFVGNTHTEALISLPSKSLAQATSYLVAINLHDRCPSSNPTSKISHVTENRCWLWVKDNRNHLSIAWPKQRRNVLVNNYSETCIRRTLEHSLRVSKTCRFFTVYIIKKKKSFTTLFSPKALVSFKTNWNKKQTLKEKKKLPTRLSYSDTNLDMTWSLKKMIKFTSSPASVIVPYSS